MFDSSWGDMFNLIHFISRSRPTYTILNVLSLLFNSQISPRTVPGYLILFIITSLSFLWYSTESLAIVLNNDLTLSSLFILSLKLNSFKSWKSFQNKLSTYKSKIFKFSKLDLLFVLFILFLLIQDLYIIFCNITELLYNYAYNTDIIYNMSSTGATSSTNTTIMHSDDGWSQGIKSIFIYGTGALRFHLLRSGGTPMQRSFVIGSTIALDSASTALKNAINDPNYVEKHFNSWSRILNNTSDVLEIDVTKDPETLSQLNKVSSKFMPENQILDTVVSYLKPILEPVSVNYSPETLANQIYGISILLFIMSILIMILLLAFIINITILVYSDKLMSLFTNKYIIWYITINKKLIGIEIMFLGASLLYFMFNLSSGIHFIATHPIRFNT